MLKINRENLRNSHETPWLILDLVMLGLLFINLAWLIFDALYATNFVYHQLGVHFPAVIDAYDPIHKNFLLVDLVFIGIFFTEFCFRWAVAIIRKEHLRWYFFPFLHWYDLVGLIPTGGTRLFRFLRIFIRTGIEDITASAESSNQGYCRQDGCDLMHKFLHG